MRDYKKIIKIVGFGLLIIFTIIFFLMAVDEFKTPTGRTYDKNDDSWWIIMTL